MKEAAAESGLRLLHFRSAGGDKCWVLPVEEGRTATSYTVATFYPMRACGCCEEK